MKKSYFPAFSSNKACVGKKAGGNAIYNCCGNSIDCHHERPSATFEQIGVAAAMIGEYMDEAVKSGSCEIVYRSPESWLSKERTKEHQEGKLGKQVAAIAIDEVHSITEW